MNKLLEVFSNNSSNSTGGGSQSYLQANIREISANTSASFVQADSVQTAFAQATFVQADSVQIPSAISDTLPLQMYRSLS